MDEHTEYYAKQNMTAQKSKYHMDSFTCGMYIHWVHRRVENKLPEVGSSEETGRGCIMDKKVKSEE